LEQIFIYSKTFKKPQLPVNFSQKVKGTVTNYFFPGLIPVAMHIPAKNTIQEEIGMGS
jgi:hypothetical protein